MAWTFYDNNGTLLQGIADNAVTNAKMADDAIGADELAANAVVDASVASNAQITFDKMVNLTTSRALVTDGSGDIIVSGVTTTELELLDGLTSSTAELNILDGVTSNATELNLLDNVSGLVQADLTKLAAVDSTAAELNLLDALDRGSILYGNASGATTVLGQGSADQVLTSDGTDISWAAAGGGLSSDSTSGTRSADAGSGEISYAGSSFTPTAVIILAANDDNDDSVTVGFADSAKDEGTVKLTRMSGTPRFVTGPEVIAISSNSGNDAQVAVVYSYNSDGITLTWTKYGSGTQCSFRILYLK